MEPQETWVIMLIVVIFAIALKNYCKDKKRKESKKSSLNNKDYIAKIYNNTSVEHKENISYLCNKINQLDQIIKNTNEELNLQSFQASYSIAQTAFNAEERIKKYWEYNKRKADFYYYIGLHYTSFMLADKLTEEVNALKKIKHMFDEAINETQNEIDLLKEKINEPTCRKDIPQIKRKHQELCKKCDALRKARNCCKMQIDIVVKQRDDQNDITQKRREYIGKNFGEKGRQWKKRILAKHRR